MPEYSFDVKAPGPNLYASSLFPLEYFQLCPACGRPLGAVGTILSPLILMELNPRYGIRRVQARYSDKEASLTSLLRCWCGWGGHMFELCIVQAETLEVIDL